MIREMYQKIKIIYFQRQMRLAESLVSYAERRVRVLKDELQEVRNNPKSEIYWDDMNALRSLHIEEYGLKQDIRRRDSLRGILQKLNIPCVSN